MNTTELMGVLRAEVDDSVLPYLVSDALLYSYIDDAQKMFCRWTEGIEDGRSFQLNIIPGTGWYNTDKSILKLRKVYNTATGREVPVVNTEKAADQGIVFDGSAGPLKAFVAGAEKNALRAWPMPNQTATVNLDVFRLSRTVVSGSEFEIDQQHVLHLLLWVKHKFYGNQDSEVNDPRKAAEAEARFRSYCADARKEQERARRVTGAVLYGGI